MQDIAFTLYVYKLSTKLFESFAPLCCVAGCHHDFIHDISGEINGFICTVQDEWQLAMHPGMIECLKVRQVFVLW